MQLISNAKDAYGVEDTRTIQDCRFCGFPVRMFILFLSLIVGVLVVHTVALRYSVLEGRYDTVDAFYYFSMFYGIFLFVLALGVVVMSRNKRSIDVTPILRTLSTSTFLTDLATIAGVGLVFHIVAKSYVYSIADVTSFSEFREAWMYGDRSQYPLYVRLSSVAGHLLSSFIFPGIFLSSLIFQYSSKLGYSVARYLVIFMMMLVVYAFGMYSKSTILSGLLLMLLGYILSLAACFRGHYKRRRIFLPFVIALVVTVIVFVFATEKADTQKESVQYLQGYMDELPIKLKTDVGSKEEVIKCMSCQHIALYLNHGIWNFAQVLHDGRRGGKVLFRFIHNWIGRFGIVNTASVVRVYGRGGVTLVGAAFHDYGFLGVVALSVVMAVVLLAGIWLMTKGGFYLFAGLLIYMATGFTIAYSLLFVGPAIMSFPFIMFSSTIVFYFCLRRSAKVFGAVQYGNRQICS